MTVKTPQEIEAYLTPEQIAELQARYKAKNASDALAALLLFMAGAFVIGSLAGDDEKPRRRRKRS